MPSLHEYLPSTNGDHLLNFMGDGFERQDVSLVMTFVTIKRTERTIRDADVGVIDVAIDDIGDHVVISFPAFSGKARCHVAEQVHIRAGKQLHGFGGINTLTFKGFL